MPASIWSKLSIVIPSIILPFLWVGACVHFFSASGSTTFMLDPSSPPLGMIAFVGGALSTLPMAVFFASHPTKGNPYYFFFGIGEAQAIFGFPVWSLSLNWDVIYAGGVGGLLSLLVLRGIEYIRDHRSPEGQRSHS